MDHSHYWSLASCRRVGRSLFFSVKGFQSSCRLTSSLFLPLSFFFFFVSVLRRVTANYRAVSHIGANKIKGSVRSESAAGCRQEPCCASSGRFGNLNSDKMLEMGVVELLVTMAMWALNIVGGIFSVSLFFFVVVVSFVFFFSSYKERRSQTSLFEKGAHIAGDL